MDYTLDDIRAAADAKYGSLVIQGVGPRKIDVELVNALRLPKEKRDRMEVLQDDDGIDTEERLPEMVRLIAKTPAQAEALLKELQGDLAVLAIILENYSKQTQAGEA